MNMTSRLTLGAAFAGLIWAGCSSPAEDDPGPPLLPPPLATNPSLGQGGSGATAVTPPPAAAQGGSTGLQTGAVPAGTGGSAAAIGGSGGAPAAAAGAAGAPASTIPTGMGNLLTHDSTGWVAGSTNGVGIQGSFFPFGDFQVMPAGTTTVTLDAFEAGTSTVCLSGVASEVLDEDYARYWGGGVGLNLGDPGGMVGAQPWSRGAVTGFSFTVTGPTIPPNLRFGVNTPDGASFCMDDIPTAGTVQMTFNAMALDCYMAGGAALTPTAALESIQWQVVTVIDQSTPFDFCIENLTATTAP
jgi:hypothetical protein